MENGDHHKKEMESQEVMVLLKLREGNISRSPSEPAAAEKWRGKESSGHCCWQEESQGGLDKNNIRGVAELESRSG